MCFHTKQTKSAKTLENRFIAKLRQEDKPLLTGVYNGFDHPKTPIITAQEPDIIQCVEWGLIPWWAKDKGNQNSCLNARIETLREKPSFSGILHRKCLILLDGFFEWQWIDVKGKEKQKYLITLSNEEPFALAGLWTEWKNPLNGELLKTYTIITTEAKGIMREIHNSKLRMPVILTQGNERPWLNDQRRADLCLDLKAEYQK
jgi:putative SOS response-associated peptidase YedK